MYTIKENSTYQYEIKKSKFITLLYKVNSLIEVDSILATIKEKYSDATHCCFAYKIGGIQKFSDDGEPGGTAGLPIMEVINKKNLDYILCIVVRYFGGIKLGTGGLVRAYSKAVREAVDDNQIIELEEGFLIKIETVYDKQKELDYLFSKNVVKKEYQEKVIYYIEISSNQLSVINYDYEIIEPILIEKVQVD